MTEIVTSAVVVRPVPADDAMLDTRSLVRLIGSTRQRIDSVGVKVDQRFHDCRVEWALLEQILQSYKRQSLTAVLGTPQIVETPPWV
jgi:hypothetical protein